MKLPDLSIDHARFIAGAGSFSMTLMVFVMMYVKPDLANNDLFKSLAQAIVIQGLIGLVLAFLFTGGDQSHTPPPRDASAAANRVADAATDEAKDIAGETK